MDYLSEVALHDIAVVDDWQEAPLGALVQMGVGPTKVVSMRTDYPAANGTVAALLVVSGEHAGELVESSHLQLRGLRTRSIELPNAGKQPYQFRLSAHSGLRQDRFKLRPYGFTR
jgi:hypothetical protein